MLMGRIVNSSVSRSERSEKPRQRRMNWARGDEGVGGGGKAIVDVAVGVVTVTSTDTFTP